MGMVTLIVSGINQVMGPIPAGPQPRPGQPIPTVPTWVITFTPAPNQDSVGQLQTRWLADPGFHLGDQVTIALEPQKGGPAPAPKGK